MFHPCVRGGVSDSPPLLLISLFAAQVQKTWDMLFYISLSCHPLDDHIIILQSSRIRTHLFRKTIFFWDLGALQICFVNCFLGRKRLPTSQERSLSRTVVRAEGRSEPIEVLREGARKVWTQRAVKPAVCYELNGNYTGCDHIRPRIVDISMFLDFCVKNYFISPGQDLTTLLAVSLKSKMPFFEDSSLDIRSRILGLPTLSSLQDKHCTGVLKWWRSYAINWRTKSVFRISGLIRWYFSSVIDECHVKCLNGFGKFNALESSVDWEKCHLVVQAFVLIQKLKLGRQYLGFWYALNMNS